jgi:hypothetical protein
MIAGLMIYDCGSLQLELARDIIFDDSEIIIDDSEPIIDDPKINVTRPLASKNLSRGGWNR